MVVWDRNGNGLIDSGRELFGDETIVTVGLKAAHGVAALRDLNTGGTTATPDSVLIGANDSVLYAKYAEFANLRIWQDLNQDGINQTHELKTLADSGVGNIKLGSSTVNTNYGVAVLEKSSSFTKLNNANIVGINNIHASKALMSQPRSAADLNNGRWFSVQLIKRSWYFRRLNLQRPACKRLVISQKNAGHMTNYLRSIQFPSYKILIY